LFAIRKKMSSYIILIGLSLFALNTRSETFCERSLIVPRSESLERIPQRIGWPSWKSSVLRAQDIIEPPKNSAAAAFLNLLEERTVCGQYSTELEHAGLIVNDGGLCGPTSLAMLLEAFRKTGRIFIDAPRGSELIANIVMKISDLSGRDARLGTNDEERASYITFLRNEGRLSHSIERKVISGRDLQASDFDLLPDELAVLSLVSDGSGHAVVLIGYNSSRGQSVIFDPNAPFNLVVANLSFDPRAKFIQRSESYLGKGDITIILMEKFKLGHLSRLTLEMHERLSR
jgi:hypothetical protein